jgi:hypothetical protein
MLAFRAWTVPLTIILELIAIRLAYPRTTFNNALILLLGIRALGPTRICIRLAIRLAGIGLT